MSSRDTACSFTAKEHWYTYCGRVHYSAYLKYNSDDFGSYHRPRKGSDQSAQFDQDSLLKIRYTKTGFRGSGSNHTIVTIISILYKSYKENPACRPAKECAVASYFRTFDIFRYGRIQFTTKIMLPSFTISLMEPLSGKLRHKPLKSHTGTRHMPASLVTCLIR